MKELVATAGLIIGILAAIAPAFAQNAVPGARLALVPWPVRVELGAGHFTLKAETPIYIPVGDTGLGDFATYLSGCLAPATGFKLAIKTSPPGKSPADGILLTTRNADDTLGDEGYDLTVTRDTVVIRAPHPKGIFYGIQTLRQLLPPAIESPQQVNDVAWKAPVAHIWDKPRFPWRGYLLDVSRHFRTKAFVERTIDLLAYHKMNVLHWHLTDDQGWRVQILQYPLLTQVGAWRGEGANRYGGFYTQDDIREIVRYAASRCVTIVPEIEMPGHCTAALAAYPQYSCTGGPFKVGTHWGIYPDIYCAGNDATFTFLENILTEVMGLFPSQFIHIGGDEAPKERWKACPKCQQRMKDEHLANEEALQSYFIRRIDAFLQMHGRRLVGWDEILKGGLSPNATVQSWHGFAGAIEAARMHHDVIVSPTAYCYLDYSLGATSLEKAYSFDPVPAELTPDESKGVLGLEGCMWGEVVPTEKDVDEHTWPRLCALAEVAWSPKDHRDFDDFSARLETHVVRLKEMGVHASYPGRLVARWTPAQVSTQWKPTDWNVTGAITQPGTQEVTLTYTGGADGVDIRSVALLQNGVEVARDTHDAFAGARTHDNVYMLPLPAPQVGATYTLRVDIRSSGGTDSSGDIAWACPTGN
jgi:hexosaminidase